MDSDVIPPSGPSWKQPKAGRPTHGDARHGLSAAVALGHEAERLQRLLWARAVG